MDCGLKFDIIMKRKKQKKKLRKRYLNLLPILSLKKYKFGKFNTRIF